MDTTFFVPTSNVCERIFLVARRATDYTKTKLPLNVEYLFFLHASCKMLENL